MMDALTIATAVITVIQATNTIISICYDYKAAATDCRWELSNIIEEVKSLRNVLENLEQLTKRTEGADPSLRAELPMLRHLCGTEEGLLNLCLGELESLEKQLAPPGWAGQVGSKRRALVQAMGWPLKERDTKKSLEKIARYSKTLHLALGADQMTLSLGIREGVTELNQTMDTNRFENRREKIHQWLAAPNPSLNHHEARKKRHATSGTWFIGGDRFRNWQKAPRSFLWLTGIPGCGKSILTSSIIEELLQSHQSDSMAIVYFYFDFNDLEKQLHEKMLRSLIMQLSMQLGSIPSALELLFSSCREGERQPSVDGLLETLQSLIKEFDEIFIVLDALDECTERQALLSDIETFVAWENQKSHVIVTSRREKDIEERMDTFIKNEEKIPIQNGLVDEDIREYISGRLQTDWQLRRYQKRPDIQLEIQTTLMNKADGMFRWAVCQVDVLGNCLNLPMLRKALASLPKTLDETYARILRSIDEEHQGNTLKILQWLCFSARPLQIEEIAEVITVDIRDDPRFDPDKRLLEPREILTICSSLISISNPATSGESSNGTTGEQVRLAHFSVKEYLISERIQTGLASQYSIQEIRSNVSIAETCLAYLLELDGPESLASRTFEEFPLLAYAAQHWLWHAREAPKDAITMDALVIELFILRTWAYSNWIRVFDPDYPLRSPEIPKNLSISVKKIPLPLYYASLTGLTEIVSSLLVEHADVNAQGGSYGNALQAASFSGNGSIIQLLIDTGADVNAQGGLYGNALQAASCTGHDGVVRQLLNAPIRANVAAQGGKYGNALYAASDKGHSHVIPLLLSAGADVNAVGGVYGSALQVASFNGHEKVVKQLIDAGAIVNIEGGVYGNALQAASCNDDVRIVQQLLDARANPEAHGGVYGNALQGASFNGRDRVIELLISVGVDVNAQGGAYGYAIQAASFHGREGVIDRLLKAGANVNAPGGSYGTALYLSALRGHERTVQQLLDAGAIADADGGLYGTALQAASFGGHYQVAKQLLDHGANVNVQGGLYGSALQTASFSGHEQIVILLVDVGGDINKTGGKYGTALQAASIEGHIEVAKLLIQAGADLTAHKGVDGVSIQASLDDGQDALVQPLPGAGTQNSSQGVQHYSNAEAAPNEDANKSPTLPIDLSQDLDPTVKDANGLTALQRAVQSGHEQEVRRLVEHYEKQNIDIPVTEVALYSQIFCDDCGARVANWDAHYHCHICLDDDFDICFACVESGIYCRDEGHKLVRRRFTNGRFVLVEDEESRTDRMAGRG